jgi:hypothetical protein
MFILRPFTLRYANFLSIFRYPAAAPLPSLASAIQSFLGNPLLFYGHQDLFDNGIDAFDRVADFVNYTQPDTRWVSLGEIVRHLYLIRRRTNHDFDVQMFSNEMDLKNPTDTDAIFHIEYGEGSSFIPAVTVNNVSAVFEYSQNVLTLRLAIPARRTSKVRISYQNDPVASYGDVGNKNLRISLIRKVSDFRDIYLSQLSWGRTITRIYYSHNWDLFEGRIERSWCMVAACIGLVFGGEWYFRRKGRKQRAGDMTESDAVRGKHS